MRSKRVGGELERAHLRALANEGRDECGLELGGRLLLVLPVVVRAAFAPEEPVRQAGDRERWKKRDGEEDGDRPREVVQRVLDLLLVALERSGFGSLRRDDAIEGFLVADLRARRGVEHRPREHGAQLDELVRGNALGAELDGVGRAADVSAHGHRVAPHSVVRAARRLREEEHGVELPELLLPLVAPDLQVEVHDVVVGDREPAEPVADREGADVGKRAVVPHDPYPVGKVRDAVRVGIAARAELGRGARVVPSPALLDEDLVEHLALAHWDVPKGA
jgi:hypothetical protein